MTRVLPFKNRIHIHERERERKRKSPQKNPATSKNNKLFATKLLASAWWKLKRRIKGIREKKRREKKIEKEKQTLLAYSAVGQMTSCKWIQVKCYFNNFRFIIAVHNSKRLIGNLGYGVGIKYVHMPTCSIKLFLFLQWTLYIKVFEIE